MRKGTIFYYELRRLLLAKEYLLLLAATLAYSLSLFRSLVIFGVDFTAPFSERTFAAYCASLAPFLFVLLLVLCVRQHRASERRAETIIGATPFPARAFLLLRYGAVACAFLPAVILPFAACALLYRQIFEYTAVGGLLWLGAQILLPPTILLFGAAVLLGRGKAATVYVQTAAVLILGAFKIPLPAALDIFGASAVVPGNGAIAPSFVAGRVAFSAIGIAFIIVSLKKGRFYLDES